MAIIEITLGLLLAVGAVADSQRQIWLAAVRAEREELMQMREQNVINDEVMRILEGDIDVEEALITGAARHGH